MQILNKYTRNSSLGDKRMNGQEYLAYTVTLEKFILKATFAQYIEDFYAPELKLFVLPLVWDASGNPIYNALKNYDKAEDYRLMLSNNNSRETSQTDLLLLPERVLKSPLRMILLGMVVERIIPEPETFFENLNEVIRKSGLNKRIKNGLEGLQENEVEHKTQHLARQIVQKMDGIKDISYLMDYEDFEVGRDLIISNKLVEVKINKLCKEKENIEGFRISGDE